MTFYKFYQCSKLFFFITHYGAIVVVVVVVGQHPLHVLGPSTTIVNVSPADVVAEPV